MSGSTTESDIFANIPDLENDSATGSDEGGTENTATNGEGGEAASSNAEGGEGGSQQSNPQREASSAAAPVAGTIQRRDGLIERPNKDNPNTRDIIDPATGDVVAYGGRERGMFERAQRAHQEARQTQQQLTQVQQRLAIAEGRVQQQDDITQAVQAAGLNPAAHKQSVELMGEFLRDPVSVLTKLVVEVKSKGYNIPFLEQGVTPGMDAMAVQRMLDQRMAPITAATQQQEAAARAQQEARTTLDNFLAVEPDAIHNMSIIGEMLTQDKSLTLERAWTKLNQMAYQAGLNPLQPLRPQYEALRQRQTQQPAVTAQNPQPRATRPLPNGRQTAVAVPVTQARQFDENSSFGDIIRRAMQEGGYSQQQ